MLRKTVLPAFFLCFTVLSAFTQPIGQLKQAFTRKDNVFTFYNTNGPVAIEFCTPQVFRVRSNWNQPLDANEPWMVVKYQWSGVPVTAADKKDHILLTTAALQVKVFKKPFRIEVMDKAGKLLTADETTGSLKKEGETISCTKQLFADEHFFGFGERMDFVDQRSKKVKLNVGRGKGTPHIIGAYNILEANYSPIPFFMSTRGYGIFFHNAFPTTWDMGAANSNQYRFSATGGEMDYYFMYGPSLPYILEQYTTLTGKAPLLPKFALGLHVGTYSGGTWGHEDKTSDRYVIELARKLRELGIPADLLWLDSTWRIFGKTGGKGATSFEWRETFTNPAAMFDSIYALNYNMVGLHLRPRFDNDNRIRLLDTAQQLKYTYPEENYAGEFVNFFDSNAVDWWWKHGVMRVAAIGAKFLKTDEGSAFGGLANESNKTGPAGKDVAKLHNLFPLAYAKAPYEKFQEYNRVRGVNQTREGYAGIQRYPFIFAGDWPSEWQYFPAVIKAGLNIGLSGVGYWAHCMGGFEHDADPELYIRWCQFGMFSPVALVFGMDHPGYKEPWNYGTDALRNFKKYDSLRYSLLPYLYSSAYQQYKTGLPLMRALVLHYQDDENVYSIGDQYMLGDNMMVCPVTTKGAVTRSVYLPEGKWFDYWTGKSYSGKQNIHVVTPLDSMPVFVKAGSIIPQQQVELFVGAKGQAQLTLNVYPGNGRFTLYEDDGKTLQYQQGKFAVTNIEVAENGKNVQVTIHPETEGFQSAVQQYRLAIRAAQVPAKVLVNGNALVKLDDVTTTQPGYYYDAEHGILWTTVSKSDKATSIQVNQNTL